MANAATLKKANGNQLTEEELLKQRYDASFAAQAEEDPKQSLWNSLSYGYGKKAEDINKNYDKAISQQDASLLKRGMQRSSAGMSTLSGLQTEKNRALSDNYDAMLADYNNRLTEMKDKEREQANLDRTFEEGQRQFNENLGLQKEQLAENQRQYDTSLGENIRQFNENLGYQRETLAENKRQYDESMAENKRQYDTTFAENQRQYDTTMEYNKGKDAEAIRQWEAEQEEAKREYDTTLAYNKEKDEVSAKQTDTQLAYNYVIAMLENGQTPTDELLQRAGLSREDAEKLKTTTATASGGGYSSGNTGGNPDTYGGLSAEDEAALAIEAAISAGQSIKSAVKSKQDEIKKTYSNAFKTKS